MCGIIGVLANRPAAPLLLESLSRLEYRGYDSAGIATLDNGRMECRRAEGRVQHLKNVVACYPLGGTIGIGHTRWATHGAPTERNAHPHGTRRVSVVHNGIIENHAALRAELESAGQVFLSETDTECAAQLLDLYLKQGMAPEVAAAAAFPRLEGIYALVLLFAGCPDLIIGTSHGAPLAVGIGEHEMFVGSDAIALAPLAQRITYLTDGDLVVVRRSGPTFFNSLGIRCERSIHDVGASRTDIGRGRYRHIMERELHEHPNVIKDVLSRMISPTTGCVAEVELPFDLAKLSQITISACGSSFYAGLVGRAWLETIAQLPTDADVASEFRYRSPPLPPGGLGLLLSQSGETADTLQALHYMRSKGQHILSIVNVVESTIARQSDVILETLAGPEIGVASTKTFTGQLTALACLALVAGRVRNTLGIAHEKKLTKALREVPRQVTEILSNDTAVAVAHVAERLAKAKDILYLGRGACFPIALEGALKLKELSYIHAEAYAAGEMKHGPIALIEKEVPVVAIVPSGPLFEKTASNLNEAAARGGQIIVFSDAAGAERLANIGAASVVIPTCEPFVAPILYSVAVQLLAYEVAVLKGTNVDQPRNLAKSVTVE